MDVVEEIRSKIDENMEYFLLIVDHSKVFYTVHHDIRCRKLKNSFKFSSSDSSPLRCKVVPQPDTKRITTVLDSQPFAIHNVLNNPLSRITYCGIQMHATDVQLCTGSAK